MSLEIHSENVSCELMTIKAGQFNDPTSPIKRCFGIWTYRHRPDVSIT